MKKTFFVVALVVTSFCCSRNIDTPDPTLATDPLYQSIAGKWNYTENGVSSGGPMQWLTVPAGEWIEFKSDGSVGTNIPAFSGVTSFQVLDSARVKILIPTFSKGYVIERFTFSSTDGSLLLTPLEPACIEGCGSRFKR
jgi:hypothetical protein